MRIYSEVRDNNSLEHMQGYSIYRRGEGYHILFPPDGARFVFVWEGNNELRLINQSSLEKAFPGQYAWGSQTFEDSLYAEARSLIQDLEQLNAFAILGRNNDSAIKIFTTPEDVLIYVSGEVGEELGELDPFTEKMERLNERWFYVKRSRPLAAC